MKKTIPLLLCSLFAAIGYADDPPPQAQAMQQQLQKLVELDQQIQNLEKQKIKYKMEAAQDLERGSMGLLPGVGRRSSRRAEDAMQNVQQLNEQIQQLEMQRQNVLMALK